MVRWLIFMVKNYLELNNLKVYIISRELSNTVWEIVGKWDYFNKKTLGDQIVRSIDSIGANVAEGFGRYHKKDKIKFYYNARGSIYESIHWTELSFERNLISKELFDRMIYKLNSLPIEINYQIKLTNDKLKV